MSTLSMVLIWTGIAITIGGGIVWYNETPKEPNVVYKDKPVYLREFQGGTSDGDQFHIDFEKQTAWILCKDKKNTLNSKTMKFSSWMQRYGE